MESRERDAVTRKVVQVVDHSATDPGRRKSRKRGRAENKKSADESRAGPVGGEDAEEGDFRRAFRDVIDFGAKGLNRRTKKEMEEERLVALGFKPAKRQKEPLSILQGKRRATRERHARYVDKARASGVVLSANERQRFAGEADERKAAAMTRQRRQAGSSLGLARYSSGVYHVPGGGARRAKATQGHRR